jgi:transposase
VADVTLHGLLTRHRQLEAMLHAERCRLAMAPEGAVRASIENLIGHLEADLPVIEAELAALEARDAEFRLKRDVLCQQIGIANKTARKLLAHVPELGQVNAKAAASLGGLAPHVHQSGTIERHQGLVHGRGCVRSTLFLPALTAMRRDPEMARFAKRLRDRGKPKMVVVVAVMRKLLVRLNARLRDALAAGTVEQTAAPAAV